MCKVIIIILIWRLGLRVHSRNKIWTRFYKYICCCQRMWKVMTPTYEEKHSSCNDAFCYLPTFHKQHSHFIDIRRPLLKWCSVLEIICNVHFLDSVVQPFLDSLAIDLHSWHIISVFLQVIQALVWPQYFLNAYVLTFILLVTSLRL